MLTDREILKLADDAYNTFLTAFLVECQFEVASINKFISLIDKNTKMQGILKDPSLKSPKDISLPVLITHGEKFKVTFCNTVLSKILKGFSKEKQKMFIMALTMHELYHIVNKVEDRLLNSYPFIKSDKRALQEFKEDYKDMYEILEESKRRFKKR